MRWVLFLSRLAFVCNVFFLLAISLQYFRWIAYENIEATVIIIGYGMVVLINPFINLCYGVLFFLCREKLATVPRWLRIANFVFLLLQIFYIIYLNDH